MKIYRPNYPVARDVERSPENEVVSFYSSKQEAHKVASALGIDVIEWDDKDELAFLREAIRLIRVSGSLAETSVIAAAQGRQKKARASSRTPKFDLLFILTLGDE